MTLSRIYEQLFQHYGPQKWWPADSAFEVMVGAILTQNTAWTNVERAIDNLKTHQCLSAPVILAASPEALAQWLRPSGYFNIKAQRLRNFCQWYRDAGELPILSQWDTRELRRALLGVNGVGPETADDMLLYAFERPVFVVDAYTRRIFSRLGLLDDGSGYEAIRARFEGALPSDVDMFNEYHALIVRHAKVACSKTPRCGDCCLSAGCPFPGA